MNPTGYRSPGSDPREFRSRGANRTAARALLLAVGVTLAAALAISAALMLLG